MRIGKLLRNFVILSVCYTVVGVADNSKISLTTSLALELQLRRTSLENVDDKAGRWQFEGGKVFKDGQHVANYATTKRVVFGGTDSQNTAMLTMTIFFLGQKIPENITLQGCHDFSSGGRIGSVSAASKMYLSYVGKSFSMIQDRVKIE